MPHKSLFMPFWTLWLLGLGLMLRTCTAAQHHKALLGDTVVYCNITSTCQPCLPKYLDSEACRSTAYTEHLTCSTTKEIQYQVTLVIHRRLAPRTTLLHISRSCKAAQIDTETDVIHAQAGISQVNTLEQAAGKISGSGISVSDSSSEEEFGLSITPIAVHLYPLSTRGGLNLLYFELAMLLLLSGTLPVVYIRKRRHMRL